MQALDFKWTVSRGRETYGYNLCTLYVNGTKAARYDGGGYDMEGACLGYWMQSFLGDKLKTIEGNSGSGDVGGFYGLAFYHPQTGERHKTYQEGDKVVLDGACGKEAMVLILKHFGYELRFVSSDRNRYTYTISEP